MLKDSHRGGSGTAVMLCGDFLQSVFVLSGTADVDLVVMNFDLETGRQEGVKPDNQVWMASKQV